MRSLSIRSVLCAALLLTACAAVAHHSITGQFDVAKQLVLSGTVSKVDWINPHIYVYVDVKDEKGQVDTWKLETVPVWAARRAGLTKAKLMAPNQVLKFTCHPARDGTAHLGLASRVDYPDGTFVVMAGMAPK